MPAHALLKQWAKPVKLSPEEVVITVKNEIYLNQFVSGSKRAVLQKAVDELFSQTDTNITVRLPMPEDEALQRQAAEKKSEAAPVKPSPAPTPKPEPQKMPDLKEIEEDIEASEENSDGSGEDVSGEEETSSSNAKRFEHIHSDTVNMVMDLFDGKLIE